ncbi:hypothetical protein HNQ69_001493 [Bartonella callosciuri]|uniref:Uncharacterized protein n=1 Tax=Bartonella callosciuri TaxID=686223 RepID=A0A840NWN5_9HYPH|nr:hypothetical protein [Bartonella callosciuri]
MHWGQLYAGNLINVLALFREVIIDGESLGIAKRMEDAKHLMRCHFQGN